MTIPGIGEVAAQIILAELPEPSEFEDARQLAAWSGLTPMHHSSGTSGKTRTPITKIGSALLIMETEEHALKRGAAGKCNECGERQRCPALTWHHASTSEAARTG